MIAPRWGELTGQREAELHNGGWLAAVHAEDRGTVSCAWRDALVTRCQFVAEFRVRWRDGAYHWLRAVAEPFRDADGNPLGWLGVTSRIDDRKDAEAALSTSVARLRLAIEAGRIGTFEWDLQTNLIASNARARDLIGVQRETTFPFSEFEATIHPDDRHAVREAIQLAIDPRGPGEFAIVFRVVRADGSMRWLSNRGAATFVGVGDERTPIRVAGAATDVTTEVTRLHDYARLSAIVSSSDDAILAATPDGIITEWNPSAERIFGWTAAEICGRSVDLLTPPEFIDERREIGAKVSAGTAVSNLLTQRLARDGRRIEVALTVSPLRDEQGVVVGAAAIYRDITARLILEEEFRQAQKLEAVGQLAGGIAHDLNNILTAVAGGIALATQSPSLDPELREDLSAIHADCFKAAGVIRQLLAFSRKQGSIPEICSVNDVIDQALPMLRSLVNEDVRVWTRLDATGTVMVDCAHLTQVLVNLATNARDAMPNGGRLDIETEDVTDAGAAAVRIVVHDSGAGMPEEVRAHLFEPFFSTKAPGHGTGLGLAAVYGMVKQDGGQISVQSAEGSGTSFVITFPALKTAGTEPRPSGTLPTGTETILLVEDEDRVRGLLARALRSAGHHVLEARNGKDALSVLDQFAAPVHLVLTDVVMPEMGGGELVTRLRTWYPTIRALFMSGYSNRAIESSQGPLDQAPLIPKPFEMHDLLGRVRSILDEPRRLRQVS
jgi:two-component system cell cycle sensor histidine kinase/response regulator CckA